MNLPSYYKSHYISEFLILEFSLFLMYMWIQNINKTVEIFWGIFILVMFIDFHFSCLYGIHK